MFKKNIILLAVTPKINQIIIVQYGRIWIYDISYNNKIKKTEIGTHIISMYNFLNIILLFIRLLHIL